MEILVGAGSVLLFLLLVGGVLYAALLGKLVWLFVVSRRQSHRRRERITASIERRYR